LLRSILPLMLIAICPLSMLFMMRSMSGHQSSQEPALKARVQATTGQMSHRCAGTWPSCPPSRRGFRPRSTTSRRRRRRARHWLPMGRQSMS
jgi:hypothetical protein